MKPFVAVIDSDCLHKLYLRGLLLDMAYFDVFQPKWSSDIFREVEKSLLKRFPDGRPKIREALDKVRQVFPDAEVRGYRKLVDNIDCPDPDDAHVLAAAIKAGAHYIVTFNKKDFPTNAEYLYKIKVISPDDFVILIAKQIGSRFDQIMAFWISQYEKPRLTVSEAARAIDKSGCPKIARLIQDRQRQIRELL